MKKHHFHLHRVLFFLQDYYHYRLISLQLNQEIVLEFVITGKVNIQYMEVMELMAITVTAMLNLTLL